MNITRAPEGSWTVHGVNKRELSLIYNALTVAPYAPKMPQQGEEYTHDPELARDLSHIVYEFGISRKL